MRIYKSGFSFFLLIILAFNYTAAFAVNNKKVESYTYEVIKTLPSDFEQKHGNLLYTGLISNYSQEGSIFAQEHSQISGEFINLIDELSYKTDVTKKINRDYMNFLSEQLRVWKIQAKKNPKLKPILNREVQVFNIALKLQIKENIKWANIYAIRRQIAILNQHDNTPVNYSFVKSDYYNRLLVAYVDLLYFYKNKYKDLLIISTLHHAVQENPRTKVPASVLKIIKPMHKYELRIAKALIYDMGNNFERIERIQQLTDCLMAFYNKIDNYSLSEVAKIIQNLKLQQEKLKEQTSLSEEEEVNKNLLTITDNYIGFYENVKIELSKKILSSNYKKNNNIASNSNYPQFVFIGVIPNVGIAIMGNAFTNWCSNTYNTVADGAVYAASSAYQGTKAVTKVATGAVYATVDYTTGVASEAICTATATASAVYDKGLFTKEYNEWNYNYKKAGENMETKTFNNTIVQPFINTMEGNDKEGLGQAGARTASKSFEAADKAASGLISSASGMGEFASGITSSVVMNVVTLGGYGLAKDYNTLNDADKSTYERAFAAIGVATAVVPVFSASKGVNAGINNTYESGLNAANNVMKSKFAVAQAQSIANKTKSELLEATKNSLKAAGSETAEQAQLAAGRAFEKNVIAENAYKAAKISYEDSIVGNIGNVAKETMTDSVKAAVCTFADDQFTYKAIVDRTKDLFTKTLKETIQDETGQTGGWQVAKYLFGGAVDNTYSNLIGEGLKYTFPPKKPAELPENFYNPNNYQNEGQVNYQNNQNIKYPVNNQPPAYPQYPSNGNNIVQNTQNNIPPQNLQTDSLDGTYSGDFSVKNVQGTFNLRVSGTKITGKARGRYQSSIHGNIPFEATWEAILNRNENNVSGSISSGVIKCASQSLSFNGDYKGVLDEDSVSGSANLRSWRASTSTNWTVTRSSIDPAVWNNTLSYPQNNPNSVINQQSYPMNNIIPTMPPTINDTINQLNNIMQLLK